MILQSLRDLAEREKLVDDPAFESKAVRWLIEIDEGGKFVDAYDTNTPEKVPEGSKKKPRMQAKLMVIPRRLGRSSGIRADFLVDNAKYALGIAADVAEADDPRLLQCHAAFLELLRSAPDETPELQAVLTFLGDNTQRTACEARLRALGGFASNDLFCFQVDDFPLTEVDLLRAWWGERHGADAEKSQPVQCLMCGQHRVPARLHNSIQVRGASTSGVPLVSFNANAFEKYGLSGNENAPVCTVCMTAYTEALRRLTRSRYQTSEGNTLPQLSTVLNSDTTAIYWTDYSSGFANSLANLLSNPAYLRDLLRSPHQGAEFFLKDASRFYCLILTGTQGRVIVRQQQAGTVGEIAGNLNRYFRAIRIGRIRESAPIPMIALLKSLVLKGELDRLPADIASELWMTALFGSPLSRYFLSTIVTRIRVEPADLQNHKWKVGRERAALLQLYFISNKKSFSTKERGNINAFEDEPSMSLNEQSKNFAYVFGRILATAERMQQLAQPQGLNRTLVDRFFSMASIRPQTVFAQLLSMYGIHRRKALRDIFPLARVTDELWGRLFFLLDEQNASKTSFDFEDQALFGLGYYHQKQKFVDDAIAAKAEREERTRKRTEFSNITISELTEETEA